MNCNSIKADKEFISSTTTATTATTTTTPITTTTKPLLKKTLHSICPTNSNNEKLVKISFNELQKLRDLYKNFICCCNSNCNHHYYDNNDCCCCNCWFEHHIGYQTINNYLKWINLDLNEMKKFKTTSPTFYYSKGNNDNWNDNDDNNDEKPKDNIRIDCSFKSNHLKYNDNNNVTDANVDDVNVDNVEKNFEIYSLNDNWKTDDGFFVIVDNHQIIFNILIGFNPSKIIIALNLLEKHIRKKLQNSLIILNGFSNRFLIPITKYMKQMEYNIQHDMNVNTLWYFLSNIDAKNFNISVPQNIRLDKLSEEHAKLINNNWSWKHKGSEDLVRRLIKYNENIGAFDIISGELVGWCLRQQVGALGILYVLESHRKQGLASLIVKKISKIICEHNDSEDICATVLETNIPSRRLFDSLGFKIVNRANWIVIEDFQ